MKKIKLKVTEKTIDTFFVLAWSGIGMQSGIFGDVLAAGLVIVILLAMLDKQASKRLAQSQRELIQAQENAIDILTGTVVGNKA